MKKCQCCGETKPFEDFFRNGLTPKGTPKYKPKCKSCDSSGVLSRNETIMRRFFPVMQCSHCGYDKCKAALEFHHRDPSEKDDSIGKMLYKSCTAERFESELRKCVLLCANCHRELHAGLWKL